MTASADGKNQPSGKMNGGRALAEMLRLHGVGPMFGMGGFELLPFYDALRSLGLTHHLINDERCGAFAADAYARVTNRPGVCDGTLGPGVTNLVTPLVEALNAGIPIVALAGDSNRANSWKNMKQECRQTEILRPAVKELIRIELTQRIPELTRRAFAVATAGRPGPVLLDVPEDVCHGEHDFAAEDFAIDPATLAAPAYRNRPARAETERAARLIAGAKRPLLLVGGGIHLSLASEALQRFAESCAIPVAHTMSGKGAIACTHPLSAGLFGRYSRIANDLVAASDCLIVVGCKLGEIATRRYALLPAHVPVIHLEIVAEELGRSRTAEIGLWGDAREGLADIADRGLASIGYGLPGGLGAALAAPDQPVVAMTGDGGFNMVIGELETARRAGAGNLTVIVVNNAASGYVKALQHAMFGARYQSSDLIEMDYAAIANAMGCRGIRVEDPDALAGAIATGNAERDRPTVIDVVVTRDAGKMLPGVDNRTVEIKKGDRVA